LLKLQEATELLVGGRQT